MRFGRYRNYDPTWEREDSYEFNKSKGYSAKEHVGTLSDYWNSHRNRDKAATTSALWVQTSKPVQEPSEPCNDCPNENPQ